jgi:UDP-N-acetyl-2-amino-2-deoxyglucuronate dehydrogenase
VDLTYITSRGKWYHHSWKGDLNKSGGIATNIGVHFFDMLIWVFGDVEKSIVIKQTPETVSGVLKLKKAEINWMLSIDFNTLPNEVQLMNKRAFRTLKLDGEEIEFSDGFTELHTNSYEQILKGNGYGMNDCRKAIELVSSIRNSNKLGE